MPDKPIWGFTHINHPKRIALGLSMNEYALADLIHHLSTHPKSGYPGWCYASKETLATNLGLSKRGVMKLIDRLEESGLIERNEVTKHLRSTERWFNQAYMVDPGDGEQSAPVVNKVHHDGEQSAPQVVNKVHPIYIKESNKSNEVIYRERLQSMKQKVGRPARSADDIVVREPFQAKAQYVAKRLGSDGADITSILRMCKAFTDPQIDAALSFAVDATVRNKTALFFKALNDLKKAEATT